MKESSDDGITVRIAYEPRLARVIVSDEQVKEIQKYYDQYLIHETQLVCLYTQSLPFVQLLASLHTKIHSV